MARIYKTTDKIPYKIGDLEVKISPLSVEDKTIVSSYMQGAQEGDPESVVKASTEVLKVCIKEVNGLVDAEGNDYALQFNDNGKLTDECVSELMNIEQSQQLIALCSRFTGGVPGENSLPEGVSLAEKKKKAKGKTKK